MQKLQHAIKPPPRDIQTWNILGRDFELEDLSTSDLRRIVAGEMNNDIYGLRAIKAEIGDVMPTIIDIGANIGMFALSLGPVFGSYGYYGIEPHPINFTSLRCNLARNNGMLQHAVEQKMLVPNGIRRSPKMVIGFDNTGGATTCLANMPKDDRTDSPFDAITSPKPVNLQQLVNRKDNTRPLIVKMDIEGAEHSVLESLGDNSGIKIDYFIGELHMNTILTKRGYSYEGTLARAKKIARHVHFTQCAMAE